MGEAKRRGTYEQRKQLAIERNEKERIKMIKKRIAAERAKTPEQRAKEKRAKLRAAQFMGMVGGMGLGSGYFFPYLLKSDLPFR